VIAIENARLLADLQERQRELARSVEELKSLGEVSRTVNSSLERQASWQNRSREVAVDKVGAHFPLQHDIAPIANVLEDEQAHNDFRRIAPPVACAA
jgi:hypothetical protein